MLKSMTAYGRSVTTAEFGSITLEISSVNRKGLEVNVNLPRELLAFESDFRSWIQEKIHRGYVTVSLLIHYTKDFPISVEANTELASQFKKACDALANALSLTSTISLDKLLDFDGVLSTEINIKDFEKYKQPLKTSFDQALVGYMEMKQQEGSRLEKDIISRLEHCKELIKAITSLSSGATDGYRKKLTSRLQEILPNSVDDERILKEVALFAEKVDITEELIRFSSHLTAFLTAVKENTLAVGKKLEFISQELMREISTILAKSSNYEIAEKGIQIKSELEKIREQLQNIE